MVEPTGGAAGRSPRRPKSRGQITRERTVALGIILLVFGLPIGLFVAGPTVLLTYDQTHPRTIDCYVTAATSVTTSSRTASGLGATDHQIELKSTCGLLLYTDGITAKNSSRIAESFSAGRYRFSVGEGSWSFRKPLEALGFSPVVEPIGKPELGR